MPAENQTTSKIKLTAEDDTAKAFASARKAMLGLEATANHITGKLGWGFGAMNQAVAGSLLGMTTKYLAAGAVIAGIEETVRRSINAYAETEKPLLKMGLNAGLTKEQIKGMRWEVSELTKQMHRTTSETIEGLDALRRTTDLSLQDSMKLLPVISKGAKGLMVPLKDMTIGVGSIYRDLNIRTEEGLRRVIDQMASAASAGLDD